MDSASPTLPDAVHENDSDAAAGFGKVEDFPATSEQRAPQESGRLANGVDNASDSRETKVAKEADRPVSRADSEGAGGDRTVTTKKRGRKKKSFLTGPALTIDELFASVSTTQASGINPPPGQVVLTPRSAEACLKHGVNPELLRIRDLDSFWEPDIEPEVQRLRHEAYSHRRHEMARLCRQERRQLQIAEQAAALGPGPVKGGSDLDPDKMLADAAARNMTMIELEQKRFEKMRRQHEKKVEQMLEWEIQMSALAEENERKKEQEILREEQRQRERERNQRRLAEQRRLQELKKAAQIEAEELQKQEMAREQHRLEREKENQRKRQGALARAAARNKEEERARKAEEHRLQTLRILQEQEYRAKRKMEEMEAHEKIRVANVERKNQENKEAHLRRQEEIKKRISGNLIAAEQAEEQRKQDFHTKARKIELRRAKSFEETEQERRLRVQERELQNRKRNMILIQTREEENKRKEDAMQHLMDQDEYVKQVQEARERERRIQRERNELHKQLKQENVDRIARMQEYRRLETLRKIAEADHRTTSMAKRRQEIIEQRRQAAREVSLQRELIAQVMEKAKKQKGSASKLIQEVLNKNHGLNTASTTSSNNSWKGQSRPTTTTSTNKNTENHNIRRSQSATLTNNGSTTDLYRGSHPEPRPEAPTLEARLRGSTADLNPRPYISPYEI